MLVKTRTGSTSRRRIDVETLIIGPTVIQLKNFIGLRPKFQIDSETSFNERVPENFEKTQKHLEMKEFPKN